MERTWYQRTHSYASSTGWLASVSDVQGGADYGEKYAQDPATGFVTRVSDSADAVKATFAPRLDGRSTTSTIGPSSLGIEVSTPHSLLGEPLARTETSGVTVESHYDEQRRVVQDGPSNQRRVSSYDASGRLTGLTLRNGESVAFSNFDGRGHPKQTTLPGGGSIVSAYDGLGRLKSRTLSYGIYGSEQETFAYDALSRLTESTHGGSIKVTHAYPDALGVDRNTKVRIGAMSRDVRIRAYDDRSVHKLLYGLGAASVVATYNRDSVGRIEGLDVDGEDIVTSVQFGDRFDAPSRMELGPGPNRIIREDEYDIRKNLLRRRYTKSGSTIAELRYAYDGADREIAQQHVHQAGRTSFFGYDGDSRLTSAELFVQLRATPSNPPFTPVLPSGATGRWWAGDYGRTYVYASPSDAIDSTQVRRRPAPGMGDVTLPRQTVPQVALTYGSPYAMGHTSSADGTSRSFDELGRVTSMSGLSGAVSMEYDAVSRLRRVTSATHEIDYAYRADGPLASASGCVSRIPAVADVRALDAGVHLRRPEAAGGARDAEQRDASGGPLLLRGRGRRSDRGGPRYGQRPAAVLLPDGPTRLGYRCFG